MVTFKLTKATKGSEILLEELIVQIIHAQVRNDFDTKLFTVAPFVIAKD